MDSTRATDGTLRAAFDTATIKDAPRQDPDRPLTPADEDHLRAHYGLPGRPTVTALADQRVPAGRIDITPPATIGVRICTDCGAWVADAMADRHTAFHLALTHPAANYARHDIQDTEPETAITTTPLPAGNYARHDIQDTERETLDTRSRQPLHR